MNVTGEDIFCAKMCLTGFGKLQGPRAKFREDKEPRKEKSETAAVWRPERTFASMEARRVGVRDEVV